MAVAKPYMESYYPMLPMLPPTQHGHGPFLRLQLSEHRPLLEYY